MRVVDMQGQKFGKLEVIERDITKTTGRAYWICKCECGNIKSVCGANLRYDKNNRGTKSCRCLITTQNLKRCYKGCGTLALSIFNRIKKGCIRKSKIIEFNITIEDAWNQFIKQDGKCALTGVELVLYIKNCNENLPTASLDRIDNNKGYTVDNIQWVHKEINMMKNTHTQEKFIDWCKKVAKFKK